MDLVSFQPLFWLLCLIPLSVVLRFSMVDRPALLKWIALGLRVLAILLLILAICRPFVGTQSDDLHLVFVLDVAESVGSGAVRGLLDTATGLGMTLARLPKMTEFQQDARGPVSFHGAGLDIRPVDMEDLLGRPQKVLDRDAASNLIGGKRVLVTRAGRRFGGELPRQMPDLGPARSAPRPSRR